MSDFDTFDEIEGEGLETIKPFPFINRKDDKEVLAWIWKDYKNKAYEARDRIYNYRKLVSLYRGKHFRSQDTSRVDEEKKTSRTPKVVVNFIQEMVSAKMSKRARFKPGLAVLPHNDEWDDRNNAKTVKNLITTRLNDLDFDYILGSSDLKMYMSAETYCMVDFDPSIGPLDEEYKTQFKDKNKKVPRQDSEGNDIEGEFIDGDIHIGDISLNVYGPDELFCELGRDCIDDVRDFTIKEFVNVEELKFDHPDQEKNIIASEDEFVFDEETMSEKKACGKALVIHYYYRPTRYLPEGVYIKAVKGAILKKTKYKFDHGKLPFSRETDIDVDGAFRPMSFVNNILDLQRHFNMNASGIARNHALASAPKYAVPKGSCSVHQLNNDFTVLEYAGIKAPEIMRSEPTPREIFEYQGSIEKHIEKQSANYGISRGEPPRGVKAAVAMQFLDEQEGQRETFAMAKRSAHIKRIYKLILETMAQYYDKDDKRMIRILGHDNEYLVESFASADFSRGFSVKIQNSSALPDSKTGKIQSIFDLNQATQEDPIFKKNHIVQMLDLANDDAFKDQATISLRSAQYAVSKIIRGEKPPMLEQTDDFIIHYDTYIRAVRERSFKDKAPAEIREVFKQRIGSLEALMWMRSTKNAFFAQKLQMIECFPIFFTIPNELQGPEEVSGAPPSNTPTGIDSAAMQESNQKQIDEQNKESAQGAR